MAYRIINNSIALFIVMVLILLTVLRNNVWQTEFTLWSDTLKKSPFKPRVLDSIGKIYYDGGYVERAIEYYKKALEINPKEVRARHHLFYAYITMNRPEKALEVITDPRAKLIEHPPAYRVLANLFIRTGKYEEALKSFERLIELEPHNKENYMNYGIFLIEIDRSENAIGVFKKALSQWPESPELFNNLGIAYEASRRFKEAEEAYLNAINLAPEAVEPRENLARLLRRFKK